MSNEQFISQIFNYLHPEKEGDEQIDNKAFDVVDSFVKMNAGEDIAELVYKLTVDSMEIVKISNLLDMLIWSTDDGGTDLLKTTRNWFFSNNSRKIELTLYMTNVYPFQPFDKLRGRILEIKSIYPHLVARCDYWLVKLPNE